MRRPIAALTALLVLLTGCTSDDPEPRPSPQAPRTADSGSSGAEPRIGPGIMERSFAHMDALQSIAERNEGNRAHGTPGYQDSLRYVEETLHAAGFDTRRFAADAVVDSEGSAKLEIIQGEKIDLGKVNPMTRTPNTAAGGVTAPISRARTSVGCQEGDYAANDATIVLVERGLCPFAEKANHAKAAGALAMIVYNTSGGGDLNAELATDKDVVPTVGISDKAGRQLVAALENSQIVAHLEVEARHESLPIVDLIADWPEDDRDGTVMVGAHLDSVPAGPGINDNASGVALALAMAEHLADEGEASGLRLGFWDAEEVGLVGSGAYVKSLREEDLERISAYINLDMVASPNGLPGLYGGGRPLEAFEQAMEELGEDYQLLSIGGASDHAWFEGVDVPVVGVYTGAGEELTADEAARFGGNPNVPRDECYHRACDVVGELDTKAVRDRLSILGEAAVSTVATLLEER